MNSELGIIIQARIGSTRLAHKMVLPFYENDGILEIIIKRMKESILGNIIILAIPEDKNNNPIEEIGLKNNIAVFRGNENNVLDRFIKAGQKYNLRKIIRVCADNPFLDMNALENQINEFKNNDIDYLCHCKSDLTPSIKTHFGFWAEGVSLKALEYISKLEVSDLYAEHVTNYLYTFPDKFKIKYSKIDPNIELESNLRLTIDTREDFELLQKIYKCFIDQNIPFVAMDMVKRIKFHPEWLEQMQKQIKKNTK